MFPSMTFRNSLKGTAATLADGHPSRPAGAADSGPAAASCAIRQPILACPRPRCNRRLCPLATEGALIWSVVGEAGPAQDFLFSCAQVKKPNTETFRP